MRDEAQDSTGLSPVMVALRDGTPVRIRPVRPDDQARLLRGVEEMSGSARYMRFFVTTRAMTQEQARYFTNVDQINHVAICAVEPTALETQGYGISRFVRDAKNARIAEFAIAVVDKMQRRGLGTILLAALYLRAQALGVEELRGEVLEENPVLPHWLPRLGATLIATDSPACRLIRWPIAHSGNPPPTDRTAAAEFLGWLDRLAGSS